MTVLPSLPVLDVYLAFDPTLSGTVTLVESTTQTLPASGMSNTYWTNVSFAARDWDTTSGRQHFLDRIEAGTLNITLDNRLGYFFNGASNTSTGTDPPNGNGSGFIIQPRMPIAITATWMGTTYPIFVGVTESIQEQITDEVNVDLAVTATDLLKFLSLCYMTREGFWPTYAQSASEDSWYRFGSPNLAIVTEASGSGSTITYTASNSFNVGDNVTISGLGTDTPGQDLNLANVTVASANADTFTVSSAVTANSTGTGNAYRAVAFEANGGTAGNYLGHVAWPTYGALIYDTDSCVDLTNGGSTAAGYIRLPAFSSMGALDFWVLGQNIAGTSGGIIAEGITIGGNAADLSVGPKGHFNVVVTSGGATTYTSGIHINDGYWHHVGICADSSGVIYGYCDGTFFALGGDSLWSAGVNLFIGSSPTSIIGGLAAYVDELVVSNTSNLSTLAGEVQQRYRAGSLLQLGFPVTPSTNAITQIYTGSGNYVAGGYSSGDRIAEVLVLAGFGSVTGGDMSTVAAITLPTDLYYVNTVLWTPGEFNGFIPVEPYYWDTPITTSTALDLIGQITDTDIGSFMQYPDGTFQFYDQTFYGTWAWDATTNTGTWTRNSYSPAPNLVWTDDDSGYAYEGPSLQIIRDDADVWTMVQVTPQAGIEQVYENTANEGRWGFSTLTKTATVHTSLNLALSTANFLGYIFQSALPRVQNVTLSSVTGNGALMTAIIGSLLGDVVEFKRTSPNAALSGSYPDVMAYIDQNMVLESLRLKFDSAKGTLEMSAMLDPYILRN